jgi:hypothetical protein
MKECLDFGKKEKRRGKKKLIWNLGSHGGQYEDLPYGL